MRGRRENESIERCRFSCSTLGEEKEISTNTTPATRDVDIARLTGPMGELLIFSPSSSSFCLCLLPVFIRFSLAMTEENGTDQQPLTVISNGTLDHDTHQHSDPSPTSLSKQQQHLSLHCVSAGLCLEMLLECGPNSTIERQIQRVLRKHFLEQRAITWKPTRVELVVNTQLTDDFFGEFFVSRSLPRSSTSSSSNTQTIWKSLCW